MPIVCTDDMIQITAVSNEIWLNLKEYFELCRLDWPKDKQISTRLRISAVGYVGKPKEVLVIIVGLDADVKDESGLKYVYRRFTNPIFEEVTLTLIFLNNSLFHFPLTMLASFSNPLN